MTDHLAALRKRVAAATPSELRQLHLAVVGAHRAAQRQSAELAQAAAYRAQAAARAALPAARAAAADRAAQARNDRVAAQQAQAIERAAAYAAQLDMIASRRCIHDLQMIGCAHCRTADTIVSPRAHGQQTTSTPAGDCTTDRPPARRDYAPTAPHGAPSSVTAPRKPLRRRDPLAVRQFDGDAHVTVSVASHVPTRGDLAYLANSAADMIKTSKTARRRWRRKLANPDVRQTIATTALSIAREESNAALRVVRLATPDEQSARDRRRAAHDQAPAIVADARAAREAVKAAAKAAADAAVLAAQRKRAHGGF